LVDKLLQNPDEIVDQESEYYQNYLEYLEDAKIRDDRRGGFWPDERTLAEYENERLNNYHGKPATRLNSKKEQAHPITNGFVAELAQDSANEHHHAGKQAGAIVVFKHHTKINVGILESLLPDSDRELYAPFGKPLLNFVEEHQLAADPEAKALSDRYKVLKSMYQKRWAIKTLASILGTEISEDFKREDVENISKLIEFFGNTFTS
jgi:hypothetical protein